MKTYRRQGITVYCLNTLEEATQFLQSEGFEIKRENMDSLNTALSWYKRAELEGREASVVKWGNAYAVGEK
jgi:hypothetical protein